MKTLLSISAAALLAATIDGQNFDSIEKQYVETFELLAADKFDFIGKISATTEIDTVLLASSKNTHIDFNKEHENDVLALVFKENSTGTIIMMHTMQIDESTMLQTKKVLFTPLQNGMYLVMATATDSDATVQIHSDGTMLTLTDTKGLDITFEEHIGASPSELIICTKNFKPVNKIIAASKQNQSAISA